MNAETKSFANAIARRGWAITPPVLNEATLRALRTEVASLAPAGRGGARNLLENPRVRAIAASNTVREFACAVLGDGCFAVRALLFDKTPAANWKVVWHQDLTIATRDRAEVAGYGPWTDKAGVPHVQPPVEILERMFAIRIHLDPCGLDNGPVRVLDGSHRLGRLSGATIEELRQRQPATDCLVEEGGILGFRPLILHASSPARVPGHRRVVHFEFAATELTPPLEWHQRVA